MSDPDPWPSDYADSRRRFVAAAQRAGARVESHPIAARGPTGEALSVEVALLGASRAEHLVLVSSGVHGVEGVLGGAVQVQALQKLASGGVPLRTGIAMVHAVNPWGFAHVRRVDENNVDVNRNFLDPSQPLPEPHPRYPALDPLINPVGAPRACDALRFWRDAAALIVRDRGIAALAEPIAAGQYDRPQGLFYGGADSGPASRGLQRLILALSADAGRVTHLDLHTGLGPPAVATLIASSNIDTGARCVERLRTRYEQPVRLDDAADNPYDARGTLSRWYRRALADTPFTYLCVEVGTCNPLRVLSALRQENRAHHWTAPDSPTHRRAKQALSEVFAPRSPRWRRRSLAQGAQVFARALGAQAWNA